MANKTQTLKVEILRETEKAINIKYQGWFFWVPKSLCVINEERNQIELAYWFYFDNIYCKMPVVNTNAEILKW